MKRWSVLYDIWTIIRWKIYYRLYTRLYICIVFCYKRINNLYAPLCVIIYLMNPQNSLYIRFISLGKPQKSFLVARPLRYSGKRNFAFFPFFSLKIAGNEFWQKDSPQIFWTKRAIFFRQILNLSKNNDFANSVHLRIDMSSY